MNDGSMARIRARIRRVYDAKEPQRKLERKAVRLERLTEARKVAVALKNKRIVHVELNAFNTDDDYRVVSFNPVLVLDDGSRLSFSVDETEIGEYGMTLHLCKAPT
jgi:hypothetical protein